MTPLTLFAVGMLGAIGGAAVTALCLHRRHTNGISIEADPGGRVTQASPGAGRFYGTTPDRLIGQRLQVGAELPWRERLTAVGELASSVAHELRTPLTAIHSAAELAGLTGDPRRRATLLGTIIGEAGALNDLIDGISAFDGPTPEPDGPVDLGRLVADALSCLKGTLLIHSIRVDCAFSGALLVPGDERQLRLALLALLGHTVRSLPEGGVLTIRSRYRPARRRLIELVIGPATLADAGAARGGRTLATGLAPALAGEVISTGHGGSILPCLAADGSACFRIHLPALAEPVTLASALRRLAAIGDGGDR